MAKFIGLSDETLEKRRQENLELIRLNFNALLDQAEKCPKIYDFDWTSQSLGSIQAMLGLDDQIPKSFMED